ncbi:MAG: leucine-rich repeat protein [Clostridia bacterium]|nr:leucine-rich repeat protein [Clostridia bacterium]
MKSMLKKCLPLLILVCVLWASCALADGLTVPDSTTRIEAEAFMNDQYITGPLNLPEGLTYIGPRAFYNCSGLTGQLIIPYGVTTIGSQAFANCTGFTGTVYIPPSVTSLAKDAFEGTNLKILDGSSTGDQTPDVVITMTDLPEGLEYEMTEAGAVITGYTGAADSKLSIPSAINGVPVVAIGDRAFYDCYNLTGSLSIPSTVTRIGASAFYGCASLTGGLTIPSSVKEIGDFAFYECLGLTGSLSLPSSVTSVGESAFAFCEGMTGSLTLPSSITLGARCFQGAGFTGSVTVTSGMTLGANVFTDTALNVTYETPGFTYELSGSSVTITGWNGPLSSGLTIPETLGGGTVVAIASEAFADTGITGAVSIPGTVKTIGASAFRSNTGITSLSIAEGVTTIEAFAFADCTGLAGTITLPASCTNVAATAFNGTSVTVTTK